MTALGTLGFDDLASALTSRPAPMVSLSPEQWDLLAELYRGGAYRQEFQAAWQNGVAFLAAADGLRGRVPLLVEWRGNQRQPGDEPVPADLRIDHVFLVSCKYLSRIVTNTAPATVFGRLLAGGHGGRSADWFAEVAPDAYQALYQAVRDHLASGANTPTAADPDPTVADGLTGTGSPTGTADSTGGDDLAELESLGSMGGAVGSGPAVGTADPDVDQLDHLPTSVLDLTPAPRAQLQRCLGRGQWAPALRPAAQAFADAVSDATAERWRQALRGADLERVLWRLLRIGSTPYFVLGAASQGSLRLRIGTAWDWRQHYRIEDFAVRPGHRAQPVVDWQVTVAHRRSTAGSTIEGHVEIRWSHGKFAQPPEAKVYLDTPHHRIPGYWPLG